MSPDDRHALLVDLWERNRAFTRLARVDLRVGAAEPWEEMEPVVGERIAFQPRADG